MRRYLMPRFVLLFGLLAACTSGGKSTTPAPAYGVTPGRLTLSSPDFPAGGAIPAKYTCQGDDSSPALTWDAPPAKTMSLALIVDDPDAPGGTWVHWLVYNLPAQATGLAEGASRANAGVADLPQGARQGKTSFQRADYGGPCPPSGTHHYSFRLYALDMPVSEPGLDKSALIHAMNGHILAQGELIGTYSKK